jgi:hypothetical protein
VSAANVARAKFRREQEALAPGREPGAKGPYCPLNGHEFTHQCRECSEFWGTSAGVMVWQYWQDWAYVVGER